MPVSGVNQFQPRSIYSSMAGPTPKTDLSSLQYFTVLYICNTYVVFMLCIFFCLPAVFNTQHFRRATIMAGKGGNGGKLCYFIWQVAFSHFDTVPKYPGPIVHNKDIHIQQRQQQQHYPQQRYPYTTTAATATLSTIEIPINNNSSNNNIIHNQGWALRSFPCGTLRSFPF